MADCVPVAVCVASLYLQVAGEPSLEDCYEVGDNQHCFRTNPTETKTRDEARSHCERIDGSYTLVAVDDAKVQIELARFMDLKDFVGSWVWTGIVQSTQDQWYWVDNTRYTGKLCWNK